MTTKWAHLPNAVHIDRVVASVTADPDHWAKAGCVIHQPEWDHAQRVAWDAVRANVKKQVRDAVRYAIPPVGFAAWYALLALVAYDDCAYMLDSELGELAILAKFGDPKAVLILPACKAFHSLKESLL